MRLGNARVTNPCFERKLEHSHPGHPPHEGSRPSEERQRKALRGHALLSLRGDRKSRFLGPPSSPREASTSHGMPVGDSKRPSNLPHSRGIHPEGSATFGGETRLTMQGGCRRLARTRVRATTTKRAISRRAKPRDGERSAKAFVLHTPKLSRHRFTAVV